MNPVTLILTLTLFPPVATSAAAPKTLLEATAAEARLQTQKKSCTARAQEWLKECEAEEAEEREENSDGLPDRTGLGWTGLGLASAGTAQLVIGYTVARWRSCGPASVNHCHNLERAYRISGGTLLATGLTFFVVDETRRYRKRAAAPARQTVINIGPRAIQVRMLF